MYVISMFVLATSINEGIELDVIKITEVLGYK